MPHHQDQTIEKRFLISLTLTALILVAEVVGGLWTGSLALLSDAAHVFLDILALGLSYIALRLSAMPADDRHCARRSNSRPARRIGKPVVVDFIGYHPPAQKMGNVHFVQTLDEAAELAVKLAAAWKWSLWLWEPMQIPKM